MLTGTESEPVVIGGDAAVLTDFGLTAGAFDAAVENDLVINFSEMILAADEDGDTITLSGDAFTIKVKDDIPIATTATVTATVDGDALGRTTGDESGDDAGDSSTGNADATPTLRPGEVTVTRRRVQITMNVEIYDQREDRVLWQRSGLTVDGEYSPPAELDGRKIALDKLVNDIVDGAQSQW